MSLKECLKNQLVMSRDFSDNLLNDFKTPEQWVHQVDPSANHALWVTGHLASADNFFISMLDASKVAEKEGYGTLFGMGSKPVADPSAYPSVDEVLAYRKERREVLLSIVDGLSDEDMATPTPEGTPEMFGTYGRVLSMAAWHEGVHAGQVSIARRALGNEPLFSKPSEPANA